MNDYNTIAIEKVRRTGIKSHTIVFVHGTSFGAWAWEEYFAPYFNQKGYDTYSFTFSKKINHGKDISTIEDYIFDFTSVLQECSGKISVIGHSVGCSIIMHCLDQYNYKIHKLIFLAPIPYYGMKKEYICFMKNFCIHRSLSKLYFTNRLTKNKEKEYVDKFRLTPSRITYELLRPIEEKKLCRKNNTLVIASAKDLGVTNKACIAVGEKFNAKIIFFPEMCHAIMLDPDWQLAAEEIERFIHE